MRKIETDEFDLFLSDDIYDDTLRELEENDAAVTPEQLIGDFTEQAETFLDAVFSEPDRRETNEFWRFIEAFHGTRRACFEKRIALVHAHGNGRPWRYCDGDRERSVRKLVKELDGSYALILLEICNPYGVSIRCRSSLLMSAVDAFSIGDIISGRTSGFESIMHPTIGMIDGYTVEYRLRQLQTAPG